MTTFETLLTIAGLAVLTVLTRSFFLIPREPVPMPAWLQEGLRYAPLAALAAVVVPEVMLTQGRMPDSWQDARLWAAAIAAAYFFWRRGILGTIVTGTVALLLLRLGLGW